MTASSIVVPWKKIARTTALTAAIVATALLAGCGGGGGGSRAVITPTPTGSNITPANVVQKATDALGVLEFFPTVGNVLNLVSNTVSTLVAGATGILTSDICLGGSGTATVSWTDVDASGTFNVGDTITLNLAACQFDSSAASTTGSVTLTLVSGNPLVVAGPLAATFDVNVSVDTVDTIGTESIDAAFQVTVASTDLLTYTLTYATSADTDKLSFSSDGAVTAQLGCFSVEQTVSLVSAVFDSAFSMVPQGIMVNAAGDVVVVDGSGTGTVALEFDGVSVGPVAGVVKLLSEIPAGLLPCAALSIDASGVTSDGSYATITTDSGGSSAAVEVFDATDNLLGSAVLDWSQVF